MSSDARIERARRWLNEQIDQLKALRNAKTRNTEFKQWRQATLTIVQRVWPGDSRRSARFRRIPFSPPSTQASARETREFYERGCAEALQLLNGFLEEIDTDGLPAESETARPASLDPGVAEDDFPTLDLPGGPPAAAESKPEKRAAETGHGEAPAVASGHGQGGRRNGNERRRRQKPGSPRRRLRDMLGLDALEKLGKEEAAAKKEGDAGEDLEPAHGKAAVTSGAPPDGAREPADEVPETDDEVVAAADTVEAAVAADDVTDDDGGEADAADDGDEAPAPHRAAPVAAGAARAVDDAVDGADEAEEEEEDEDDMPAISTADFLSASPVFRAEGRPVRRQRRETPPPAAADLAPAPLTSSTAIALAAIASEVARLGVPDGHRARIRASLISLAQLVEDGEIDWEGLRGAVAFAMEFPPVGRRLLPLLIPFLDKAA